jgi:hypothetical protein
MSTEKILASEEVLCQVIRDETVLLDLKTERYFGLDDVGSRIWALIKEGASKQDLVTVLAGEYEVSEQTLTRDIEQFMANLAEEGLLSGEKPASSE